LVLPTTRASAVALLILAFVCFTIWPQIYKRFEALWRFEFFALDFGAGALVFGVVVAYTFGTLGPEMPFTDRLLVAGTITSFWTVGTGALFALANTLLLASITLLGLSVSFLIFFGLTAALTALGHHRMAENTLLLYSGASILILSAALASLIPAPIPGAANPREARVVRNRRLKGIGLSVFGGLLFGFIQWLLKLISDPDFGPGPYATVLLLSIGMVLATPVLNFYFLNIKIVRDPAPLSAYWRGRARRHIASILAGVVFALGALAVMLAASVTGIDALHQATIYILPFLSVIACTLIGFRYWKEFAARPSRAKRLFAISLICFLVGISITGAGLAP
jgi:glucose uptake protein